MNITRRSIFLATVFMSFLFQASAAHLADDGLVLDTNDAIGALAGCAAGGAMFGIAALLNSNGYIPASFGHKSGLNPPAVAYAALAAGVVGLGVGAVVDIILSIQNSKRLKNHESVVSACTVHKKVSQNSLMSEPEESLLLFVTNTYDSESPFEAALEELLDLQERLEMSASSLEKTIERIEYKKDSVSVALHKKCKKLLSELTSCTVDLKRRQNLIAREQCYTNTLGDLAEHREKIEFILQDQTVMSAQMSYEKMISYGLSVAGVSDTSYEFWPLVQLVRNLRLTVQKVNSLLQECFAKQAFCENKSEKDNRYLLLVREYAALSKLIKRKFPYTLFEKRIRELFADDTYQKELAVFYEHQKHEQIVGALHNIKDAFQDRLQKINSKINDISSETSRVRNDVQSLRSEIGGLKSQISNLRNANNHGAGWPY